MPADGPNPTDLLYDDTFDSTVYAVFGQLAYDVMDNLEVALALRFDTPQGEQVVPADGVVTVTEVRTWYLGALAEGHAKKTDMAWGGGGGLFGSGGLGALGGGAYANTEIGQVIALAYLQAYHNLVQEMGGLPDNASAANTVQALRVVKPARLFTTPKGDKAVRTLDPGMLLYPTGNKSELMWEVEDELGNKGWVLSTLTELAK